MKNGVTSTKLGITALYTQGNVAIIEKEELINGFNIVYAEFFEFMDESEIVESRNNLHAVNDQGMLFRLIGE